MGFKDVEGVDAMIAKILVFFILPAAMDNDMQDI